MIRTAPSILSADFARLAAEVDSVRLAGADWLHVDVMDGLFVPNISIGLPVVQSLRKATDMFLDVHLMIDRPRRYARRFCQAGSDLVCFHLEADTPEEISAALDDVRAEGKLCALALKPATEAGAVSPYLDKVDMLLAMTVEPGFGGQRFMADMLPKIAQLRRMIDASGRGILLEVDGGIDGETSRLVTDAGADVLVAGSFVFKSADRAAAIAALRG